MKPQTIQRYRIDRAKGITSQGTVEIAVLVITTIDGVEHAFALSKVDARLISQQLGLAAIEAQQA